MTLSWLSQRKALPIVLLSSLLLAGLVIKSKPAMQHLPAEAFIPTVHIIEAKAYWVNPAIKGFGVVQPDIEYEAHAEVSGKIVYLHPQLKDGAVVPQNTIVIRIEADDFQSSLKQAQASSDFNLARIQETQLSIKNTRQDLKLAKAKLKLAKTEYARLQKLLSRNLVAQSLADNKQTDVLKLQQEVQLLESRLKTLPQQLRSLQANLSNTQAATSSQQRQLQRTTITLPFNARISSLKVENNQYVSQGSSLFTAQTTDKMLVNAQFPLLKFRQLAKDFLPHQSVIRDAFNSGFSSNLFTKLGLTAEVRLSEDIDSYWQAKVERIRSQLDEKTRSLGIFVSVDKPNAQIIPGIKPPLLEGMYSEVTIKGKPRQFFILPRDALHEGEIYILDKDNKLQRRMLKPTLLQAEMALFEQGIEAGEKIIVSDLFPAIDAMKLTPVIDKGLEQTIASWAKSQSQHR